MNVWFTSDQHYSHTNLCLKFVKEDGTPARTYIPDGVPADGVVVPHAFKSVEEMDELMIERHNRTVGQFDKCYFLGDVGFNKNRLESILPRLNGKKRLILGNHDKFEMSFYERFFEKIMESWQPVRHMLFTHRPTYFGAGDDHHKVKANVHGHIHNGEINDSRYLNISCEKTNYSPVHFDWIVKKLREKGNKGV